MKKFYDIHFHAFNLSHPNILAFISRINWQLLLMTTPVSAPLMGMFGWDKKIKNLLTMVENDIGNYFLIIERYLQLSSFIKENYVGKMEPLSGWKRMYKKIVLTPLIMDFGFKNFSSDSYYNLPAQKPILEQVFDLMNGINFYNNHKLLVKFNENNIAKCDYELANKEDKLFEIYPFLGLNTNNNTLKSVVNVLDEYFSEYDGNPQTLYNNMGGKNGFAGIKVYPPLGFNPYPDNAEEKEKTDYLFSYCEKKGIPITTHCSDGGFSVLNEANDYTNPKQWRKVLKEHPDLKLNFAHMGKQNKKKFILFKQTEWQEEVFSLLKEYKNAYADFSCTAFEDSFYLYVGNILIKNPALKEKIMFGSDFMINLLWTESYNSYFDLFMSTTKVSEADKNLLCCENPERFLFS